LKIGILSVACSLGSLALRAASPEPLSTPAKDLRSDTWTATDALGRALPGFDECGPRKGNRVVGMIIAVPAFAVIYDLISRAVHRSLRLRKLPMETDEYRKLDHIDEKTGTFMELNKK